MSKNNFKSWFRTFYYMYILKIPYSELIRLKFNSTKNFLSNVVTTIDKKYVENDKMDFIGNLQHSIEGKSLIGLRSVFVNSYKNNIQEINKYINNYAKHRLFKQPLGEII